MIDITQTAGQTSSTLPPAGMEEVEVMVEDVSHWTVSALSWQLEVWWQQEPQQPWSYQCCSCEGLVLGIA